MTDTIFDILSRASKTGENLRVVYSGGSQPGTVRDIVPIAVTPLEVRARDVASGIVKQYSLAKMRIAKVNEPVGFCDPTAVPLPEPVMTVKETFSGQVAEFQSMGWYVQLSDDEIGLCRYFKNGKPRKAPAVALSFSEFESDVSYDLEAEKMVEVARKSTRPYRLVGPDFASARVYGKLSSAIPVFLEQARKHAPHDAP